MLRAGVLLLAMVWAGFWFPWSRRAASKPKPEPRPAVVVDFDRQIKPILAAKCQPCHFPGGSMHARLPFDEAATIRKLGTQLFTRIRDENDRRLIRAFLAAKP